MISFIIITNGKKYDVTVKAIDSIKSTMGSSLYEIILIGNIEKFQTIPNIILIDRQDLANSGNVSAMRNIGAEVSNYDILTFLDDDVILHKNWFNNFKTYDENNNYSVYANKILLPDGGRYWDRAVIYKTYQSLVSYSHDKYDKNLYQTGTFMVIKKCVFNDIKFDENIKYYSGNKLECKPKINEDVDFSQRLYNKGYCIDFDVNNTVYHYDYTVIQVGSRVVIKNLQEKSILNSELSRYEYVRNLYLEILKRIPDESGLDTYLLNDTIGIESLKNILLNSKEACDLKHKSIKIYSGDEPVLRFFWNGSIASMSDTRFNCYKSIISNSKIKHIEMVTPSNFKNYEVKDQIIHPAFEYLNPSHQSDYVRAYIGYFYGGGYTDIKHCSYDWNPYFDILKNNPDKELIGYRTQIRVNGKYVFTNQDHPDHLNIGAGYWICKKGSSIMKNCLDKMTLILDKNYDQLKNYPGTVHPYISADHKIHGWVPAEFNDYQYPLEWTELMMCFHSAQKNNNDKLLYNMPNLSDVLSTPYR